MAGDERAAWLRDAGVVALAKVAASCAVLAMGFRAVSDDDYARVVIAERWAHAPGLDPSGTSWLPLPFWMNGAAMLAFGRSLATARALAFAAGLASALLVYQAARWMTGDRRAALAGALFAALFPWSARLGVATVPELPSAALAVFALATLAPGVAKGWRLWGALALFAATLSRYEAWFLAAGFAAFSAWEAAHARGELARRERRTLGLSAALACAGPLAWIAWNRGTHGEALNFLSRVSTYHHALGAEGLRAGSGYLVALARAEPEIVFGALGVGSGITLGALGRRRFEGFARPLAVCAAMVLALSVAAANGGAPTHHAERALLPLLLVLAVVVGAALVAIAESSGALGVRLAGLLWVAIGVGLVIGRKYPPDEAASVDRSDEVAIGEATERMTAAGERVLVEVVDYGHLAVIAGFGRPEDAVPDRELDPRREARASSFGSEEALRARVAEAGASVVVGEASAVQRLGRGGTVQVRGAWRAARAGRSPRSTAP